MIKTLTKHGNSYALIIDKPILELLHITPESSLEVSTDGTMLMVKLATEQGRKARIAKSLEMTNKRYGRTLKRLAE